ncbi:MAG: folate-binding protein [Rhodospirillales bacterium]
MTSNPHFALLEDRGLLAVSGNDAREFLQGLISNDIHKAGPGAAIYAALLTPQGKYLHDFFIVEKEGALLLDCERARLDDLKKRLGMYKLRADVALEDRSDDFAIVVFFGEGSEIAGIGFPDPRLKDIGGRAILPKADAEDMMTSIGCRPAGLDEYDALRLSLGLPDGSRDLVIEKSILLESGFDELNGIDWDKGCYMGQELTARTKYRGLVKKRLVPVIFNGAAPPPATPVMMGEKEAGEMRSSVTTDNGGIGLALLRLENLEDVKDGDDLKAGEVSLTPQKPAWMAN